MRNACGIAGAQNARRIEIQLRTPWQGLKFGLGPDDLREYYRMMADVIAAREEDRIIDEGVWRDSRHVDDYITERLDELLGEAAQTLA